jgi:hypothetical protein
MVAELRLSAPWPAQYIHQAPGLGQHAFFARVISQTGGSDMLELHAVILAAFFNAVRASVESAQGELYLKSPVSTNSSVNMSSN